MDIEDLHKETGGDLGAKDEAFGPGRAQAGVVVGVEVGEKVGDGEISGGTESVDDEAGLGDKLGVGEVGRKRGER